ncbi:MAG: hypothetical protein A3D92_18925, partial [Bacteroidetes bacterium RIFCSPHIGHO2_02_FULL_44_7]
PQVSISGQFNHFINIPVSVVDATLFSPLAQPGETLEFRMGTDYSTNGTLSVNQLLFNGSYIIGLQAIKHVYRFQESSFLVTKEDVVFNVIQAYQLAAIAKENLAFTDSMVLVTEALVNKQQNYFDLGLIVQEDMDQLQFSLQTARNAQVSADIQYQNTLNILKYSMGLPMNEGIETIDGTAFLLGKKSLSEGDIHNNLQYALMEQNIVLSTMNVKNNQFANLPSLNAFFTHSYNAYRNEFNFFANEKWYPQTVWGIQLNVPVFSGLQRHARTSQAKIQKLQNETKLEQMERTLQLQEIQLKNNLRGAQNKYALQAESIRLAESIYKNAVEAEQIGKGNSLTVTQKHNQVIVAQAQYLGSLIEVFQAQLALDKLYNELIQNQ